MNSVCCTPTTRPDAYALAEFQSSKFNRAGIDVQASAGISLVTADGDRVTLNASSSLHAALQTYDYLGRTQGQTVAARGEEFQLATSAGYAITVEGTLDEDELADIRQLLNALSSASKDFFAGKSQGGLRRAAELDDFDSIASFEASFNYSRRVTAVAASQLSSAAAPLAQVTARASAAAGTNGSQAADSFVDQLRRAALESEADNVFANIPKRFAALFQKLVHRLPLDDDAQKLAKSIESESSRRDRSHRGER